MKKQFIKVNTSWQSKNKLQALLQEEIKKLDQTLWPCETLAREAVVSLYKKACERYTGKCELLSLSSWENTDNSISYGIDTVFQVTIYKVLKFADDRNSDNSEEFRRIPKNVDEMKLNFTPANPIGNFERENFNSGV